MTRYFVEYQPHGRPKNFTAFDSMLARDLFTIAMAGRIHVTRTWEEAKTDAAMTGDLIDRMVAELPATRARIAEEKSRH